MRRTVEMFLLRFDEPIRSSLERLYMNNAVVRASIIHWMASEIEVEHAMAIATITMAELLESLLKEKLTSVWENRAPIILEQPQ